MVSHVLYILMKGLRVLNKKGKEGSILALYRPGQGQTLHFFKSLILGFRFFFFGMKLEEIAEMGVGGGRGKYHILHHGPRVPVTRPVSHQA